MKSEWLIMQSMRSFEHCLSQRILLGKLTKHSPVLTFLHSQIRSDSPQRRFFATMSFAEQKDKYLSLSLEEKRKGYKCKDEYNTLSSVQTWSDYFESNKSRLTAQFESCKEKKGVEKREVRSDLAQKVSLWKGDITTLEIDAIVNAANKSLLGGGGVDGAIHRAAGNLLKKECTTLNGCKVGEAKITGGYALPAKYVVHTVGPQGEKPQALQNCYESCLNILKEEKLKSIAFPCISTGIYGYPQEAAAKVALKTIRSFLETNSDEVDRVVFCLFMPTDVTIYENLLQLFFPTS